MSQSTTARHRPQSTISAGPPPSRLTIDKTAHISEKAVFSGPHAIIISSGAVVHPFSRITASEGDVVIGEGCIIWEKAVVGVFAGAQSSTPSRPRNGEDDLDDDEVEQTTVTVLDQNVVVETGAVIEAGAKVHHNVAVEAGARISRHAVVGAWSKITPRVTVQPNAILDECTVVCYFSEKQTHRVNTTLKNNERVRQLQEKNHEAHLILTRKLVKGGGGMIG